MERIKKKNVLTRSSNDCKIMMIFRAASQVIIVISKLFKMEQKMKIFLGDVDEKKNVEDLLLSWHFA